MSLFKKKPGGTFLGNVLRTVSNKASGGFIGTGANMLPLPAANQQQAAVNYAGAVQNVDTTVGGLQTALGKSPVVNKFVFQSMWKEYKVYIIALLVIIIGLIVYNKSKKKKFRRY